MIDVSDLVVLVPDGYGLAVCGAADLLARLDDGAEFADAVNNAAIDTIGLGDPEAMVEAFAAVAALNATGDAAAYWQVR
jgi:hypothetical protein